MHCIKCNVYLKLIRQAWLRDLSQNSPIRKLTFWREKLIRFSTTGAKEWVMSQITLQWRHNGRDSVSNHQPHDCLLKRLFRRRSKKTSKLRVTGLCAGNSPGTGEFPAQMASNAENISIWWRHHEVSRCSQSLGKDVTSHVNKGSATEGNRYAMSSLIQCTLLATVEVYFVI